MGRPAKGSVASLVTWDGDRGHWIARVTLPKPTGAKGDFRKRIRLDGKAGVPFFTMDQRAEAEQWARESTAYAHKHEGVRATTGKTCNEWFDAYYEHATKGTVGRKPKKQVTANDRRARYTKWIAPFIGTLEMTTVTADHLRPLVRHLNEQIGLRMAFYALGDNDEHPARIAAKEKNGGKQPGISGNTAINIWGEITAGFKEATISNHKELNVRKDNPATLLKGPTTPDPRTMAALYPDEIIALLSCEHVPLRRRVLYAAGLYTGLRQSELRGLLASHVLFARNHITVRGQVKKSGAERTEGKSTAAHREVKILATLKPLLVRLVKEHPTGPLLHVPPPEDCAELVRKDLRWAGVTRADLFTDNARLMPFDFHGLRHTWATHRAMVETNVFALQKEMGHSSLEQTRAYVDTASMVDDFGPPHPPLPASVVMGKETGKPIIESTKPRKNKRRMATPTGIEASDHGQESAVIPGVSEVNGQPDLPIISHDSPTCPDENGQEEWLSLLLGEA